MDTCYTVTSWGVAAEKAGEASGAIKDSVASHQTPIGQRELVKRMWGEAQTWLWDQLLTGRTGAAGKTRVEGCVGSPQCRSEPTVPRSLSVGQPKVCPILYLYLFSLTRHPFPHSSPTPSNKKASKSASPWIREGWGRSRLVAQYGTGHSFVSRG